MPRLVLVCNGRGLRREHTSSLGLHSTVFQTEIYTINTCVIETIERGYVHRNIYILSNSQAAIKALDNFQINSKLIWDATSPWWNWQNITGFTCMGARICGHCQKWSSWSRLLPSTCKAWTCPWHFHKVARGWLRAGWAWNIGSPFVDKGKLRTFLKDPLLKELRNYSAWAETC